MLIPAESPDWIPLTEVPKHLRSPRPPHLSTVMRWVLRGVGNPAVRLGTIKIGGRRYTNSAMIESFIKSTSAVAGSTSRDTSDDVAFQRAQHNLDAEGIQ